MPTSHDEEALDGYAKELGQLLGAAIAPWVERAVATRLVIDSPELQAQAKAAGEAARADIVPALDELLALDIDAQSTTPLTLARRAVPYASAMLRECGVPEVARDEHARSLHPHDVFDLTPGGFVDFGDDVQSAGLTWGAAKAHVHIQRRRLDAVTPPEPRILALVPNLMDRSRFGSEVMFVTTAEEVVAARPTLVLVDIDRVDNFEALVSDKFVTVGFGSHVDEERHHLASAAGFDEVMARSVFFRRLPELLVGESDQNDGDPT